MSTPIESDCRSVKARLDAGENILLLDCREQDEWEIARMDGATLIPISELQERVVELEPYREREIVVFCHHGVRSLRVTSWLRNQGYDRVQSLTGGIDHWSQEIDRSIPRY